MILNEYLGANRLSALQKGILANQFLANWEDINTDNRPPAVIALSCIFRGFESFPPDKGFFSEFDFRLKSSLF